MSEGGVGSEIVGEEVMYDDGGVNFFGKFGLFYYFFVGVSGDV